MPLPYPLLCADGFQNGTLSAFRTSLVNDLQAATAMCDGLDMNSVEPFLSALEDCQGAILTSGVGEGHAHMNDCADIAVLVILHIMYAGIPFLCVQGSLVYLPADLLPP